MDPISEKTITPETAQALLEADRLTVVSLANDGMKLMVRVIGSTDALAVLKDLDDTAEILLYVGPAKEKLPDQLRKALGGV